MIKDLIIQNRTCRRFYQDVPVSRETLRNLVDLARLSASGANRQPLKYILSNDPEKNARIFPTLGFAGQLQPRWTPPEGERPAAYIIILLDTEISKAVSCDHGIAAESILLGAREVGLGGCMHGSAKKKELTDVLSIPPRYEIQLVISIGKPKEKSVIETVGADGSTTYWRDAEGVHHVPKRKLDDIIIG